MSIVKAKSSPKRTVSRLIKDLPDDCTYEDIQYELYVLQKIESGLAEVDKGKTYTSAQMKTKLKKWTKK